MASTSRDAWVCRACRSFNPKRATQCYRCRAPREAVAATPQTLPTVGGTYVAPAIHPYRSSQVRALLVLLLLPSMHLLTTAVALYVFPLDGWPGSPIDPARTYPEAGLVAAVWLVAAVVLTTAWAAWISRVVDNLPALGLGYAHSSPRMAFVECFVVGPTAIFAPARLREVARKLDPGIGPGLVNASWLFVVGPPAAFALIFRVARWVSTVGEMRQAMRIALPFLWAGATIGIVMALIVVSRVEHYSTVRAAEQRS